MKKILILLLTAVMLCTAGCSGEKKAGKNTTEDVDQAAGKLQESLGDQASLPSESVKKAVSDTWFVPELDKTYELKEDGTGTVDGKEKFTFECGFDDENNITLKIVMDDTGKQSVYAISTDDTGYGIDLESLDGGKDLKFLPENLTFLDPDDKRVRGLIGKWNDASGNEYVFDEKGKISIINADDGKEVKGVYTAVSDQNNTLLFRIAVEGGSLEYQYTLSDDGKSMDLVSPGTDTVHHWTKSK